MKNRMSDVRDHLVAMLENLGDKECNADTIARAKATSDVAQTFINAVKVEIDARNMLGNHLPPALEEPVALPPAGLRRIA